MFGIEVVAECGGAAVGYDPQRTWRFGFEDILVIAESETIGLGMEL